MTLRAVIFDMDGTLFLVPVDWREVRKRLGIPNDGRPILDHFQGRSASEQARLEEILSSHEKEAVQRGRLRPGAQELLAFLRTLRIPCILVTNNSRRSVETVLCRYGLSFDLVVTRDDRVYKPNPAALLLPLKKLGVPPKEAALVGDSHLDLLASWRAGIGETILVAPQDWVRAFFPCGAYFREARDLGEVKAILAHILANPSD